LFVQLLKPRLDLVTLTSPIVDDSNSSKNSSSSGAGAAGGGPRQPDWQAPYYVEDGVTEQTFRRALLSSVGAVLDLLGMFSKHATCAGTPAAGYSGAPGLPVTEEAVKALALLLVQCSSFPNVEIVVPAVLAMSSMGQRDSSLRIEAPATGCGCLLPTVLNALLTNALLRRLQDPNAYACETTQQDKQARLLEGCMQVMDSSFNAIIDLHTSDEPAFLATYAKLQCTTKLSERGNLFAQQLHAGSGKLDSSDLEKFSETWENLQNFIQYKLTFVR
jgi:hypothetical protein